ncbi:MAG: DNA-formamidopyrimidine glycosylase family protein [Bacteriovoracaceae bacterium]
MEGPSIVILSEELQKFVGKKILSVSGNSKVSKEDLKGRTLDRIDSWGKVLYLIFSRKNTSPIITRTHFMMFGSYRIDDPKAERIPRIELKFRNGTVHFYSCSFKFIEEGELRSLDRRVDVLEGH